MKIEIYERKRIIRKDISKLNDLLTKGKYDDLLDLCHDIIEHTAAIYYEETLEPRLPKR